MRSDDEYGFQVITVVINPDNHIESRGVWMTKEEWWAWMRELDKYRGEENDDDGDGGAG